MPPYAGLLAKYGHLLDLPSHTGRVTLLEGNTPLIPVPKLASAMGGGGDYGVFADGRYHLSRTLLELNDWLRLQKKLDATTKK